ncbi:MAG TPA: PIG-L family deacetylase [Candidatus Dormibacteraeota bacterium]|jgi:LmbE family N-acetylglucosaminyl deacetylase|nr:PIG-L family deacetylase [Candidatus Dormibacteraeota bacterium]
MATLMAVHAHPDDEGIQTGGVLALAKQRGVRTVLVTCTNGDMGDSPDGLKPEAAGHDSAATVATRLRELRASCEALGIDHLELLGYRDSGMMGWPQNDDPTCFWRVSLDEAAGRVGELMERYRPEVVVTYDADGLYGHPDHIQAHRATMLAAERTGIPQKVYEIAFPRSLAEGWAAMRRQAEADKAAAAAPEATAAPEASAETAGDLPPEEPPRPFGTPDELITTKVDVASAWAQKRASLFAHQSQLANFDFLKMDEPLLAVAFGTEHFVRRIDRTGAPVPESDLFAGIV